MKKTLLALALTLGSVTAQAGHIDCEFTQASAISVSIGGVQQDTECAYGHDNNDNLDNPLDVNAHDLFGDPDWDYLTKIEYGDGFQTGNITLIQNFLNDQIAEIMFVFKSGNSALIDPREYVAYMWEADYLSTSFVNWNTMFFKDETPVDVSHVSIYYREGNGDVGVFSVDEPNVAWLLLPALAGIFMEKRRRRYV